ncbi:MAG: tyrosine-type recombinase/integrase [Syntrophomonas sp.]|nr:tyrosine-type recombinase/integrase [Syntrophomonas sp.]
MRLYSNVLGKEMCAYLNLLDKSGRYTPHVESLFRELERFIPKDSSAEEALSPQVIFAWDSQLTGSQATRKKKYIVLRGFMRYLSAEGIHCDIPETPRKTASAYTPYIFDESEWRDMIHEADNLSCTLKVSGSDMPIAFPMIIRLLYACGLRLSEALSLKSGDIDFDRGCLTIRKAKRNRQRLVPMKQSTADLLMKYCIRRGLLQEAEAHLFAGTDGKPYSNSWVERWFAVALELSGIKQERCYPGERGICPHCLRHTFVFRSFQSSGDSFDGTVPFLSTYLGHENIMKTDRYLRFSYELYPEAQERISEYTRGVFPEVKA